MRKTMFLATIFTASSLVAITSDDYPALNQEQQEQQIQNQRLQDQRLQDQRLQNQRLENRRQDQRWQDRRLEQQRQQNKRYVADATDAVELQKEAAKPTTPQKDRYTTTEDHKLANLIRARIIEIATDTPSNDIILIIDNGDVKLTGKVVSEEAKAKIATAIQQMKGVKSVHNQLVVIKNK